MHFVYILILVLLVIITTLYMGYTGYTYYNTPLDKRFYHPEHSWFKPSGIYGQGLGVVGTFMIIFGVSIYIARKRYGFLAKTIRLKYMLEFHIFLCTLGPILILFHTTFKFGGIVSIAFWSMVAVVLSGFIGRFIYIQIPRTIEGRALSLSEVKKMKVNLSNVLSNKFKLEKSFVDTIVGYSDNKKQKRTISLKNLLKDSNLPINERIAVLKIVRNEISLSRKIERLETMQSLFKYWHVIHLPFALILLIILCIHVGITVAFGYKWIF